MTTVQNRKARPASCVFCGRTMTTPNLIGDNPLHPDCFTRMCVAAFVKDVPKCAGSPTWVGASDDRPGVPAAPVY